MQFSFLGGSQNNKCSVRVRSGTLCRMVENSTDTILIACEFGTMRCSGGLNVFIGARDA